MRSARKIGHLCSPKTLAWSIRLDLLGIALGAAEVGVNALMDDPPTGRGAFAAIVMGITAASMGVRLLKQSKLSVEAE